MRTTKGIIPHIFGISEEEIQSMIEKHREKFPKDTRTNEELRPPIINLIMYMRKNKCI